MDPNWIGAIAGYRMPDLTASYRPPGADESMVSLVAIRDHAPPPDGCAWRIASAADLPVLRICSDLDVPKNERYKLLGGELNSALRYNEVGGGTRNPSALGVIVHMALSLSIGPVQIGVAAAVRQQGDPAPSQTAEVQDATKGLEETGCSAPRIGTPCKPNCGSRIPSFPEALIGIAVAGVREPIESRSRRLVSHAFRRVRG